jgi:hypothetical protein
VPGAPDCFVFIAQHRPTPTHTDTDTTAPDPTGVRKPLESDRRVARLADVTVRSLRRTMLQLMSAEKGHGRPGPWRAAASRIWFWCGPSCGCVMHCTLSTRIKRSLLHPADPGPGPPSLVHPRTRDAPGRAGGKRGWRAWAVTQIRTDTDKVICPVIPRSV